MPAYNCAAWIDEFLESLVAQDCTGWRIVARDDASTDNTASRLIEWQSRLGDRMMIVEGSGERNLGMIGNYNAVLAATTSPLVMLADPDDVWRRNKISLTVSAMRKAEAEFGATTPLLVCTDAEIVDHQLRPMAESFWQWSRINPAFAGRFHKLVVESPVLSATSMVNRALLDRAMPLTGGASCPDWWLALMGTAFGRTICLPERTILYRRHGANDSQEPFGSTIIGAVRRILADLGAPRRRIEQLLRQLAPQAHAFGTRFRHELTPRDQAALEAAARLPGLGALMRRWTIFRHDLWFGSPMKNFALLLFL
jgi:glycosyltransferase involved in cell wall biosynthesis